MKADHLNVKHKINNKWDKEGITEKKRREISKKEQKEFHIFVTTEFISEKNCREVQAKFLEFLRIYYKTLETLLDFSD